MLEGILRMQKDLADQTRKTAQTIGNAAILTRATAGTAKGKLIVCLPGSPGAVETALRSFISEFPHIVSIAGGSGTGNAAGHANSENHLTKH